jgi:hypothetical protein
VTSQLNPEHALWGWWWAQRSNRPSDAAHYHGWLRGWLEAGGREPRWANFGPTQERWRQYRTPPEPPFLEVLRAVEKKNTHPE